LVWFHGVGLGLAGFSVIFKASLMFGSMAGRNQ